MISLGIVASSKMLRKLLVSKFLMKLMHILGGSPSFFLMKLMHIELDESTFLQLDSVPLRTSVLFINFERIYISSTIPFRSSMFWTRVIFLCSML